MKNILSRRMIVAAVVVAWFTLWVTLSSKSSNQPIWSDSPVTFASHGGTASVPPLNPQSQSTLSLLADALARSSSATSKDGSLAGWAEAAGVAQGTQANFKIAFIGDQGFKANSVAVLNLIKSEGAEAVVHQGDFDYQDNPAAWDARISNVLGANFPYFASIGNHDVSAFRGHNGYQDFLTNRMNRVGISWSGDLGVRASFYYKGIFFVQVAPGIKKGFDSGKMDQYIRDRLAQDNSIWSICSWHKNMHLMQAGGKSDDTGWEVYEESRKGGAIIATGHEHSYFRTHLLSSMVNQTVTSTSNTLALTKGNSFVFVSGLGGNSIRDQEVTGPWIAKIYANPCLPGDSICQPNAQYGALFGVFNVDGQPNKAFFYFKDVNGMIVDTFTVISNVEPAPTL